MMFKVTKLQKNGCKESLPILARLRKRTQHTEIYTARRLQHVMRKVRTVRAAAPTLSKRHAMRPRRIVRVQIFLAEL